YIGFGDYRTYCKKSGNTCISPRHQVDDIYIVAHSHAVSLNPNSHGKHLKPEYLSGVKNDV
ncbi:TPA: macro domain-containing protein, partial [Salmonella enterica]